MKNLTELSTTDGLPLAYNRQYFTLIFRYIEPPILISGAFTNFLTIIALVRARHSFSPSVVFYYLTMAIADFISGCSYFYCVFAKETVPLWLGDPYPPKIATTYQLPTKFDIATWSFAELYSYYALQLLTIERTYALLYPFKARQKFGLRFSVLFYLSVTTPLFFLIIPPTFVATSAVPDPYVSSNGYFGEPSVIDAPLPVVLLSFFAYGLFFYIIPQIITWICLPIITYKLFASAFNRQKLTRLQKDIPLAEMRTTIVTAIIAIVNVTIQIPMGISVCIYSEQFNTFSTNIPLLIITGAMMRTCVELMVIPHILNFYIYMWRLPAFRGALCPCCVKSSN